MATDAAAGSPPRAQRRQITVMFCDLVGSTTLSVKYDPEDFTTLLDAYRGCCEDILRRYDATIARYIGDALLVYFGYPTAHETDAERAVAAAIEILDAVQNLSFPGDPVFQGLELSAHIGIATGEVIVGQQIGEGIARQETAIGETPNLAARLEALAEPGWAVVSDATRRLVGDLFDYVDLGLQDLKGFDTPVRAWRVLQPRSVESRFQARRPHGELTPLVGRREELDLLKRLWDRTCDGHGQAVLIEGDAGMGKSRLVEALGEVLRDQAINYMRFSCAPFYQQSALHPVIDRMQREAGITKDDTPEEKRHKLATLLPGPPDQLAETLPFVASLFDCPAPPAHEFHRLSPQRQRDRTIGILVDHVVTLAAANPTVIVFEDLHWIDPTTLDLLGELVERLEGLAIMLLATVRAGELHTGWEDKPYVTRMLLQNLDPDQRAELVEAVTGRKVPAEVLDYIRDKTDGVPLFIEELTKNFEESGLMDEGAFTGPSHRKVPATLSDSLMARLDRLPDSSKSAAQIGAVIGRRFPLRLLSAMAPMDQEALRGALDALTGSGLVHSKGTFPDVTYSFKHALVQDAAYDSMLRRERRQIHLGIARELEKGGIFAQPAEPELLAHHLTEAGALLEAVPYWQQAGQHAGERASHAEAVNHYESALRLIAAIPESVNRDQLELGVQVLLGLSLASERGYAAPEVAAAYERARVLCDKLGNPLELFAVLRGLCTFYIVRDELDLARTLADRCMELARETGRPEHLIESYTALGYILCHNGALDRACSVLEQCLDLYQTHIDQDLPFVSAQDSGVACGAMLAIALCLTGRPDSALQRLDWTLAHAEQFGPFNLAYVHTYAALLHQLRGEPDAAAGHAGTAIEISRKYGFPNWECAASMHLGIAQCALGQAEQGHGLLEGGLGFWRAIGAESFRTYFLYGCAEALLALDRADDALAVVDQGLDHADRHNHHLCDAMLYNLRGTIVSRLEDPDLSVAERNFESAIRVSENQHAYLLALRAAVSLFRLRRELGGDRDIEPLLRDRYERLSEGATTREVREAATILGERGREPRPDE